MADDLKLPSGATLVTPPAAPTIKLPPGATLVQSAGAAAGPNVNPTASDDDIISSFGFDPKIIKSSPRYQDAVKQHGSGVQFALTKPGTSLVADTPGVAGSVLGGVADVGQGANDVLSGIVQLARHGAGAIGAISNADVQYGDLLDRVQNQDFLHNVRHDNAHPALRFLGNALVPVPGGPEIQASDSLARVAGVGALQGAKVAATQPVTTGAPDDYGTQKLLQTGTGLAVGGTLGTVSDLAGKGLAKAINAYTGQNLAPDAASAILHGKEHQVTVTPGDITRNPMLQKAEVLLESVPGVGTGGIRAGQQTEAKTAAENLQGDYFNKFLGTQSSAFDDVKLAAQQGDEAARAVAEKMQNAGNDPDRVAQASIGLANWRTRQTAEGLYDKVEGLVTQHGLGDVPLPMTTQAVNGALKEAQASKIQDKPLIGLLGEIKANISPRSGAGPTNPFPPGTALWNQFQQNASQPTIAAKNDYGAIRQLRSDLGDRIRMLTEGDNTLIGQKGLGQLERLRSAIDTDLSDFATNSGVPEIETAGRQADQYYKTARVPFKDGQLAQAAVSTEPDQIFQQFIKAGKGDRAQKFYDALDPKGQAAVRYSMVQNAVNNATNPGTGTFSPQKFFTTMSKLEEPYQVFFKGLDRWQVDGFQNLMAHVTRAGQFAENPPTGNRLVPLALGALMGGAATQSLPATAGAAGVLALAKPLMMSDAGKRFLIAASRLQPGSSGMQGLLDRITQDLPAIGARSVTMPGSTPTEDFINRARAAGGR